MSRKNGKDGKDNFWDADRDWGAVDAVKPRLTPRCYESHPRLALGGGTFIGGSCTYPVLDTADVYVGLEHGMKHSSAQYPWAPAASGPIGVQFPITDMAAPKDAPNFIAMIGWLAERLAEGKTVHVGCMGGHGRTGVVLSALVKQVTGNADATAWVREHYCKKAVESTAQVKFLSKHFGINEVAPTKSSVELNYGGAVSTRSPPPTPRYYQDVLVPPQRDLFVPGSQVPRARGPRDVEPVVSTAPLPVPKALSKAQDVLVKPDPNARESIWKRMADRLTNTKD